MLKERGHDIGKGRGTWYLSKKKGIGTVYGKRIRIAVAYRKKNLVYIIVKKDEMYAKEKSVRYMIVKEKSLDVKRKWI